MVAPLQRLDDAELVFGQHPSNTIGVFDPARVFIALCALKDRPRRLNVSTQSQLARYLTGDGLVVAGDYLDLQPH